MSVLKGSGAIVRIGDGGSPVENFTQLDALERIELSIEQDTVDASDVSSGRYRLMNNEVSRARVTIVVQGFLSDSNVHESLQNTALLGSKRNMECVMQSGQTYSGSFTVERYNRVSDRVDAQHVNIIFASAGTITLS